MRGFGVIRPESLRMAMRETMARTAPNIFPESTDTPRSLKKRAVA